MALPIRSPDEIDAIRQAGANARRVLNAVCDACRPGTTTGELDDLASVLIDEFGAVSIKGVTGPSDPTPFPGTICVNVNEEAAHGCPGTRILREGDLVSVDVSVQVDGWWADVAEPVVVGDAGGRAAGLREAAGEVFEAGLSTIGPGVAWSQVAGAVREAARRRGVGLVVGLDGHGVGRELHEAPVLPVAESAAAARDLIFRPGMVVTLEPTVTEGDGATLVLDNAWTVVTIDRGWVCFRERTLAITRAGVVDLTRLEPGQEA
jgi:methionyl aminopeptidase